MRSMPPNAENCKILHEEGLCCPSYHCESMEFTTGMPPTHSAENQVAHRDEEPSIDSTTAAQPSGVESQTNVEDKLDSTTVQSPELSSKVDETLAAKPESETSTEAKLEPETSAPEIESTTAAKLHDDVPSDVVEIEDLGQKFGEESTTTVESVKIEEPTKTDAPIKSEIVTEAATAKYEPESTTLFEAKPHDEEHKVEYIPEIEPEIVQGGITEENHKKVPPHKLHCQMNLKPNSRQALQQKNFTMKCHRPLKAKQLM